MIKYENATILYKDILFQNDRIFFTSKIFYTGALLLCYDHLNISMGKLLQSVVAQIL